MVSELYNGTATDGAAANFWGLFGPFVIVKWGLECFQNERARFDISKNAVKKLNRTKNDRVRKCWKLPTFTNPSSGGPDKWPRSLLLPPLLNLLKVGNSQYFITRSFLVRFDFFTAFLEISKRALSFWKHSRPHFTMTNGPKRPQKLAAAPSVMVPLYNSETTFLASQDALEVMSVTYSLTGR